jgi:hypothetical protein
MPLPAHSGPKPLIQFRNHFYSDGRTPWMSDQLVARPLPKHKTTQTQNTRMQTPNIDALSGIRTHDRSVRASEDSSMSLGRGHTKETSNRSANRGNSNTISSVCAAPFSNMCSTQADNNSRKLRLRCGCQFSWSALALRPHCYCNRRLPFVHIGNSVNLIIMGGTRYCSWLRRYVTSRKVAGSIPDYIIGVFNWSNPSSRSMSLGSTQPLREMSTRNLPGG